MAIYWKSFFINNLTKCLQGQAWTGSKATLLERWKYHSGILYMCACEHRKRTADFLYQKCREIWAEEQKK